MFDWYAAVVSGQGRERCVVVVVCVHSCARARACMRGLNNASLEYAMRDILE